MPRFHRDGGLPEEGAVFVFGSNLAGMHGGGAARAAAERFGAESGVGEGPTGRSYAIPTLGRRMERCSLSDIEASVAKFLAHARRHESARFFVTRVGCGIAGFADAEIAPMFRGAGGNCCFAEAWRPWLE